MLRHNNVFVENAKANEMLAFIKADPNFTTDRSRIASCAANQDAILLMPSLDEPYTIEVFQRIKHAYSNIMTGNVSFALEDKTWQLKINRNGEVDVYNADGLTSAKHVDEFLYNQQARTLIATLKRDAFYQCTRDTYCSHAVFSRVTTQTPGVHITHSKIDVEVNPSGSIWYVITARNHTPTKPNVSHQHDLKGYNDAEAEAYHQRVIAPLLSEQRAKVVRPK